MVPRATISLVTHNGANWLTGCLASIQAQDLAEFELLVVDNASTDGSVELLRGWQSAEPRMLLTELATNVGYAAAHNRHILQARGEFVLLLNQDVELDSTFLREALAAFQARPKIGAVQARLLGLARPGQRTSVLDSTGLAMHRDRRVVARRQGELETARDLVAGPVWGVDGPAPVYRRSALLGARLPRSDGRWEVLDEDFFMYKEDVDLAWRLRRLGWMAWYQPQAVAWHGRGAGGGRQRSWIDIARSRWMIPLRVRRLSWRNQRLMQLKNDSVADLARDLPWIGWREVLSLGFVATTDPRRLSAVGDLVRMVPSMLAKRRAIRRRVVSHVREGSE